MDVIEESFLKRILLNRVDNVLSNYNFGDPFHKLITHVLENSKFSMRPVLSGLDVLNLRFVLKSSFVAILKISKRTVKVWKNAVNPNFQSK